MGTPGGRFIVTIVAIGALGTALAISSACSEGECTAPYAKCGTLCIDFQKDPVNCGACGKACADGQECNAGACVAGSSSSGSSGLGTSGTTSGACPIPEQKRCGSSCVNLMFDRSNCGECDAGCSPGEGCFDGVCQ